MTLHVQQGNDSALNFYKKHGFEVVEELKDYYTDLTPSGCFVLEKVIWVYFIIIYSNKFFPHQKGFQSLISHLPLSSQCTEVVKHKVYSHGSEQEYAYWHKENVAQEQKPKYVAAKDHKG